MMCIVSVLHGVYLCKSADEIKRVLKDKGGGESAIFDIEERVKERYKEKYGIEMPQNEIEIFDILSVWSMLFWLTDEEYGEAVKVAKLWETEKTNYEGGVRK